MSAQPGGTSGGLGLLLIGSATALLVPAMAAASSKPLGGAVITMTALRFSCAAAYELAAGSTWRVLTGVIGFSQTDGACCRRGWLWLTGASEVGRAPTRRRDGFDRAGRAGHASRPRSVPRLLRWHPGG